MSVKIGDLSATSSIGSTDGVIPIVGTALDTTYKITVKNLASSLSQVSSSISASRADSAVSSSYAYAGGSNLQLQFNNNQSLGGVSNATWDGTTLRLTGSFNGSLTGTATGSLSGSFIGIVTATGSLSGSFIGAVIATGSLSGSFNGIATGSFTGLHLGSISATGSISGSFIGASLSTGSLFGTSSWAINATTASSVNTLVQNVLITGSLVVSGANGAGVFSQGATLIDYTNGISNTGSYMVWRAPFSCSVVGVYGYREGGGPAKINAARTGSVVGYGLLMSSDLNLTVGYFWSASVVTLQNTTFNTGDALKLIMSGSASNNQLAVQVDFIRKF